MSEKSARKRKKPQPRKRARLRRRAALVAATIGVAAGGFLAGFLPTVNSGGHSAVTGDPAGCVVFRVSA
jgi:anti-sigma factor RsiW